MKNNCCMCILNCFIRDTIKITRKIEVFNTQNNKLKIHLEKLKKKKPAHAYFRRPYFSKSFGGKIRSF